MNKENMEIYELGREVPKEAQKSFTNGKFSGTDINPMWRIKKLTEIFGPAGFGWYYIINKEWSERTALGEIAVFVDISLFVKWKGEWSQPIQGTGGNTFSKMNKDGDLKYSDEAFKMALTDAISVSCKALGIGADIYFQNDKTKYTAEEKEEKTSPTNTRTNTTAEEDKKEKILKEMKKAIERNKDADNGNKIIAVCKSVGVNVAFGMNEAIKYNQDISQLTDKELKSIYNAIYSEAINK